MKKRITKRLLSALLVVMMLATMLPMTGITAFAADDVDYLCFTALEDSSISLYRVVHDANGGSEAQAVSYQYSYNGVDWTTEITMDYIPVSSGQKIYYRCADTSLMAEKIFDYSDCTRFQMTGKLNVSGNIMTLADKNGEADLVRYAFESLFKNCRSLVDASQLKLPSTNLAPHCYDAMFVYCTSLIAAPELPATELAKGCYESMFEHCTSLKVAPELPATDLAEACYLSMFYNCTSLTVAPELPADNLVELCYYNMFGSCTSLSEVRIPNLTSWHDQLLALYDNTPLYHWLSNVAKEGTIYVWRDMEVIRDTSHIPEGWNIVFLVDTELVGSSSEVTGNIAVDLYFTLAYEVVEDETAEIIINAPETYDYNEFRYAVSDLETVQYPGVNYPYYIVPDVKISAKEMTPYFQMRIEGEDTTYYQEDETYYYASTLENITHNKKDYTKQDINIAYAMANYGSYAQLYFDYCSNDIVWDYINGGQEYAAAYISDLETVAEAVEEDGYYLSGVGDTGVKYYGSLLSLESELMIKHFFQLPKGYNDSNLPKDATHKMNGTLYEVDVKVNVKTLNQARTIVVDGAELTYSPFTYIKKALSSSSTSQELKAVCGALYDLYAVANGRSSSKEYDVILVSAGGTPLSVIKALRTIRTELGLKEAKTLVESAPVTIAEGVSLDETETYKQTLEAAGATVEIVER